MRATSIVVTVLVLAVAAGVYFGLEKLYPRHGEEEATMVAEPTPMPAPAQPDTDLAEDAPAEEATEEPVEPAMDDTAAAEPEAAPEETEPAPETEPEMAAQPEEAPEEPAAPAPRAQPRAPAQVASAEPAHRAPARDAPPAADTITAWWPDPAKMAPGQLKLMYAGQVQDQPAIALLFSAALNIDSINKNSEVRDESGGQVQGSWELGRNTRLAVFKTGKSGRYTVILAPTLADATGHLLGTPLQGPVYVK